MVSALNGRVSFKVTKFESLSSNSGYDVANAWLAGSLVVRTWVSAKRFEAGLTGNPLYAGSSYNYGTNVNGVFTQTAQDIADQKAAVQATLSSPFITNPAFWEAWKMPIGSQAGMSDYRWQNNYNEPWTAGLGGFLPDGMTATSDNLSEGYEFELYIKPTDNWDITLNASKTTAVQTNIGGASTRAFLRPKMTSLPVLEAGCSAGRVRARRPGRSSGIQVCGVLGPLVSCSTVQITPNFALGGSTSLRAIALLKAASTVSTSEELTSGRTRLRLDIHRSTPLSLESSPKPLMSNILTGARAILMSISGLAMGRRSLEISTGAFS